eukprot:COSAG05_NODE_2745_length_2693_cov_1.756361_1_plen_108_part_00
MYSTAVTTQSAVRQAVEGVARTEPVRGVTQVAVVTPAIIKLFLQLDSVRGSGRAPWSSRRVRRAIAAAVTGFVAFLRKGELDQNGGVASHSRRLGTEDVGLRRREKD